MPRNGRCVEPGLVYHVTQRGVNRQRVFFMRSDYRMYLSLLRQEMKAAQVRILSYCLMTNHIHLLVVPEHEESLAILFRRVHGKYAHYINIRRRRQGHLWQARFFSCPVSERRLWSAIRYVEQNPCRAHMVEAPEQYRWSSAAALMGRCEDGSGILDLEFWKSRGGAEAWIDLHGAETEADELRLLRRCTYAGRPFGEEEFVSELEVKFQRSWRRWSFEKRAEKKRNGRRVQCSVGT